MSELVCVDSCGIPALEHFYRSVMHCGSCEMRACRCSLRSNRGRRTARRRRGCRDLPCSCEKRITEITGPAQFALLLKSVEPCLQVLHHFVLQHSSHDTSASCTSFHCKCDVQSRFLGKHLPFCQVAIASRVLVTGAEAFNCRGWSTRSCRGIPRSSNVLLHIATFAKVMSRCHVFACLSQ